MIDETPPPRCDDIAPPPPYVLVVKPACSVFQIGNALEALFGSIAEGVFHWAS
jgi:hypothetical protein